MTPRLGIWCSILLSYGTAGRDHRRSAAPGPVPRGQRRAGSACRRRIARPSASSIVISPPVASLLWVRIEREGDVGARQGKACAADGEAPEVGEFQDRELGAGIGRQGLRPLAKRDAPFAAVEQDDLSPRLAFAQGDHEMGEDMVGAPPERADEQHRRRAAREGLVDGDLAVRPVLVARPFQPGHAGMRRAVAMRIEVADPEFGHEPEGRGMGDAASAAIVREPATSPSRRGVTRIGPARRMVKRLIREGIAHRRIPEIGHPLPYVLEAGNVPPLTRVPESG